VTWTAEPVLYRLRSPLHVGYRPWGTVALTRYYVPARNIWAAFVDAYVRRVGGDYEKVGGDFKKDFRYGYFFVARPGAGGLTVFTPAYRGGGLEFGGLDVRQFERRFIGSRPATAITPDLNAAAEGTLREVEYISPRTKDATGDLQDTLLAGVIWHQGGGLVYEEHDLKDFPLVAGGERTYGFGVLAPMGLRNGEKETITGLWPAAGGNGELVVAVEAGGALRAHAPAKALAAAGEQEPLRWREFEDQGNKDGRWGFGQRLAHPGKKEERSDMFYVPGTTLTEGASFIIDQDGLWRLPPVT